MCVYTNTDTIYHMYVAYIVSVNSLYIYSLSGMVYWVNISKSEEGRSSGKAS